MEARQKQETKRVQEYIKFREQERQRITEEVRAQMREEYEAKLQKQNEVLNRREAVTDVDVGQTMLRERKEAEY